jgi:esterase/lipase superfamily enzyme
VLRGEFFRWFSPNTGTDMDLLVFGRGGARVLVFPTSHGSYHEFRDRGMITALERHIREGWLQIYCVDSFDAVSWFARYLPVRDRVWNHLRFEHYIVEEVLPFSRGRNPSPYLMALGCSFGAFHAALLGLRHPQLVNRIVGLAGYYDSTRYLGSGSDEEAYYVNPMAFMAGLSDPHQRDLIKHVDIVLAVGEDDPSFENNAAFSRILWGQEIWHAFRVWDGASHDWPYWQEMVLHYVGGPDTR